MATAPLSNLTATWNAGGTTFTAIKMNVTDTASASGSLLMDLQVGGTSQFSVNKAGLVSAATYSGATGGFSTIAFHGTAAANANAAVRDGTGFTVRSSNQVGWVSDLNAGGGTVDLSLFRDAANTLAQRNGVNAQAFRVYNTYTDASNYERGVFDWSTTANTLTIGTAKAGTGASRDVSIVSSSNITLSPANGSLTLATATQIANASRYRIQTPSDGIIGFYNSAGSDFSRLQFGGTTNSFPSLKRAGAQLQVRLADDSAYAVLEAAAVETTGSISAQIATAIPAGGTTGAGVRVSSATNFGVFFGSGAPTLSAAKGSLYLRSDGSGVNDRMYVNTNGSTTWTAVTTAA
jgi:hypothetical protein